VYLSELNIVGFKSFARKTHLVMNDGITAIVGPNGCGKSNVVDSIRWVMGEQRSGVLRSEVMGNVIFNGSATAKPVGMAEVSLTIQNTKNILPVDYPEVVITRRLFRSGESQYLINGNQCRLKDILDLFMDTGAGPHTYSVIELPQVERILNGKEDERRHIFEEAAGITKYKLRRKATFRKLESTEKDLIRVEDIMSEVDKNVRTLRRQVTRAQRYKELADELRQLEIDLANHEFTTLTAELEPMQTSMDLIRNDRESASSQLASEDAEYEATRTRLLELEKQLMENQRTLNELNQNIQKFEERVLVNRERIRSLEETSGRNRQEKETFVQRLEVLQGQYDGLVQLSSAAQQKLTEKREQFEALQRDYEAIRGQYEQKRSSMRDAEIQVLKITEELSRKRNEGERLKANEENLSQRIHQLEEEGGQYEQRSRELARQLEETRKQEGELSANLDSARGRLQEARHLEEEAKRAFDAMQKSEAQEIGNIEVMEHQADLVKRLIDNFEDYPAGVRYLATHQNGTFSTLGPLANLIRVDGHYRTAIAAALGEAATYLVVENSDIALAGVSLLREEKKGIVTFIPHQALRDRPVQRPQVSDLGVIGWADELVQCDERHGRLVQAMLAAYLVVQDLQTAHRVFDEVAAHEINVVTLTGEVLGHAGLIRGGILSKNQSEFVGRQEQLASLQKDIERARQSIVTRRELIAQREAEIQQRKIDIEALELQIKGEEEQLAQMRVLLGQQTFEEQSLAQARQKRDTERQHLLGEISELGHHLELQTLGADDLQSRRQQLAQQAADLNAEAVSMEQVVATAGIKVQEAEVEVARLQSDFTARAREQEALQRQLAETQAMIQLRSEETEQAAREMQELAEVNDHYAQEVGGLTQQRQTLQNRLNELEEQQYEANTRVAEAEKQIRAARNQFDQLSESAHQMELRVSELRLRLENLRDRMWAEFEYKLQRHAVSAEFDSQASRQRAETLREKLKEIGPVNLLALKEFEQEKERLEFLQNQRDDLIKARKNLNDTIELINTTARKQFLDTFEQVQKNFTHVFSTFFPGGKANLVLQETADPLESEIDILATPGGKKPSALTLLSGGEKSLTAISLLFAIYLVKPSPFCIFDEVDAPLDDQNVGRFTHALHEFSKNTQFIVVTHNKLTMRAADQLYGITMEEQGVSKVVSVRFDSSKNGNLVPEKAGAAVVE